MEFHTFRLKPGQKLRESLVKYCSDNKISAATIVGCVGGLSEAKLRMAGATPDNQDIKDFKEDLEIVSLEGTIGNKDCHIHIAVSDKDGQMTGGHLKEGIVHPTAEVTIIEFEDRQFNRKLDSETGFEELNITPI